MSDAMAELGARPAPPPGVDAGELSAIDEDFSLLMGVAKRVTGADATRLRKVMHEMGVTLDAREAAGGLGSAKDMEPGE